MSDFNYSLEDGSDQMRERVARDDLFSIADGWVAREQALTNKTCLKVERYGKERLGEIFLD